MKRYTGRRLVLFVVLSMFSIGLCYAGTLPLSYVNIQYRYDSTKTTVEFNYAFVDTILVYRKIDNAYKAWLDFSMEIRRSDEVIESRTWSAESDLLSATDTVRHESVGKQIFYLAPGQYSVSIKLVDRHRPLRKDSIRYALIVRRFHPTKTSLSDIELCKSIELVTSGTTASLFERSGYQRIPIPSQELRDTMPVLRTYVELYNLPRSVSDTISVLYSMKDGAARSIVDLKLDRKIVGNSQTEVFTQAVDFIPSGVYFISITLLVPVGDSFDSIRSTRKFYIINPNERVQLSDLFSEDELFLASEFATMNEKRITTEYEKARAVGPEAELVSFPQLNSLNAKQKFMFRYWLLKDPDPTTAINERYEQFKKAVDFAVKNYTSSIHPRGWDCDQARVLMKYGFPTNIDREYFNWDSALPYETWVYDKIQGGAQFVFVNLKGSGNFVMVHSTALNEHRDDGWYQRYAFSSNKQGTNSK